MFGWVAGSFPVPIFGPECAHSPFVRVQTFNSYMKESHSADQLPVIEVKNLSVTYRVRGTRQPDKLAVKDLCLSVRSGEVFGFLGPNGAGKTTTMNVLLGFVNATGGDAFLFGTNVREPIARQESVTSPNSLITTNS